MNILNAVVAALVASPRNRGSIEKGRPVAGPPSSSPPVGEKSS
jgi:hypothetical protein